jgi:hypothetical protein
MLGMIDIPDAAAHPDSGGNVNPVLNEASLLPVARSNR